MGPLTLPAKAEAVRKDDLVMVDDPNLIFRDDIPEPFRLQKCNGLDLFEVTGDQLQHYLSNGELTAVDYTKFCLENIRKVSLCGTADEW